MTHENEAEVVAKGLTEAQRVALTRICDVAVDGGACQIAAFNRHTYRALERRGLVAHYIFAMVSCALPCPLGLAVRAILTREKP